MQKKVIYSKVMGIPTKNLNYMKIGEKNEDKIF